jgi:hypothetical protein
MMMFFSLCVNAQLKVKVELVIDPSLKNEVYFLKKSIEAANQDLAPVGIILMVEAVDYKRVFYNNADNSLDSLRIDNQTITIGSYSKPYNDNDQIGLAYVGAINTKYSKLVVNIDTTESYDVNGSLIAHEVCHLYGLRHTKDKHNLMYFKTTTENLKLNNNQVKYLKNVIKRNYEFSTSSKRIIKF